MLILTSCQDSYEDDESPEEQIVGRAPSVNKQKRVGLFFGTEEKQNENFFSFFFNLRSILKKKNNTFSDRVIFR